MHTKLIPALLLAAGLAAPAFAADAPHWSYDEHGGAAGWGELDAAYATCKDGKEQSPIDISSGAKKDAKLKGIQFGYTQSAADVLNNGHTIQVNLKDGGGIKLGSAASDEYKLLQFHFHTPSEEYVDGRPYPLVAHLVHKSAEGKLAVVGVLFKLGKENAALKDVLATMSDKAGASLPLSAGFNASILLPKDRHYYAFKGSLTTPPCSEGVRWQVMKQPLELSAAQLASFQKLFPVNARPVQPLNAREVRMSN